MDFRTIFSVVPDRFRKKGWLVAASLFLRAVLDFAGVVVFIPVLARVLEKDGTPRSVLPVLKRLRREVPVYTIGDVVGGHPCNVTLDYVLAGRLLAAYFLDAGCRNVIFSGYESSGVRREVYRGWSGEFAARGIPCDRKLRIDTSEDITEKIRTLFEKRPVDGLFSFGTETAAGDRALSFLPAESADRCVFVTDDTPFALYGVKHRPEAEVILSPLRTAELCAENLYRILTDPAFVPEELILNADEVVKSPGIPNDAPLILKLKEKGIPVISEIEFAGRYTDAKMICITGSNGKTTTTSLIYHIFKSAGLNVGLAGNIGNSLALQVATEQHDYYVIELSSFQLDNMYKFRVNIAVLMNITPDHLDRYDHCMQNYVDAKFRITQNQTPDDAFVFWNDDPIIKRELAKHGLKAHLYPFSAVKEEGAIAYVEDGEVEINAPIAFNMEQEELALRGTHNLYNSLAAGISANLAGIKKEYIRKALSDFKGVEHRLEKVCDVRGVHFINDSKATNVNSCWYALQSMTTKTVLILGGKDKGNDYTEIEDLVREKCSALVYLGLHNEKLHDFFDRLGLPVADVQTGMKDAVEAAFRLAKKGETVLLSPCCASFDLFKSYEDRGDQFKKYVREL